MYLQGSPFKLAGTFDRYYYKKYKTYKNFWYDDGKVILLEFRICPIFYRSDSNWRLQDCLIEIRLFCPTRNFKFWGCLRSIWPQEYFIVSLSFKYYDIIAFFKLLMSYEAINYLFAKKCQIVIKQLCSFLW